MSCVGAPTLTEFTTITTSSVSESTSTTVSSLPASVSSTTSVSCIDPAATDEICLTSTIFTTFPGGLTTIEVPITIYIQVIVTEPVLTLFESCTDTGGTGPTTSYITSQSTPPPTVITTSSSSTMPNGVVTVQLQTITSSPSPTVVYVPTILPTPQNSGGGNRLATIAPIIGGVVGGFFGLITIVGIVWFFLRRRRSWDDIFEPEDTFRPEPVENTTRKRRFEMDPDAEPKPYHYGLVGQVNSPPVNSPPASPTFSQAPLNPNNPTMHGRHRSSLTPLMVPVSSNSSSGPSMPATASSRPSTAGSANPLHPPSQHGRPPSAGSTYPARPPSQHERRSTVAAADEIAVWPMSVQSHSQQNSSWGRQSPPVVVPANWAAMTAASPPDGSRGSTNRSSSQTSLQEPKRPLQIVNSPPTPNVSMPDLHQQQQFQQQLQQQQQQQQQRRPSEASQSNPPTIQPWTSRPVVVHQDAMFADSDLTSAPPAYEA